jgi:class 3 adenylate cyclase
MLATRRLAAILAADVAGYSRLMGTDEEGTLERLKALRRELLDPTIADHQALAACYAHMGRFEEARDVVGRLRAITSAVIPPNPQLRNPEHLDLLLSGLRLAAGETV